MSSIFVICEIDEGKIADVSLELMTKGKSLANQLKCPLEVIVLGHQIKNIEEQLYPYGVDVIHLGDDQRFEFYTTLPFTAVICGVFKQENPQIALLGASTFGRDLGPRVSSALYSGLTADCTSLEIGDYEDKKAGKTYQNLLYQIRPAFGGNIVATIINPDCRPQMATVREGVMKKEIFSTSHKGKLKKIDVDKYLTPQDLVVKVIDRIMEKSKVNIKNSSIIIAGGYGMGSKENFNLLFEFAEAIGGEVGASRAAIDAGYADHDRQIGQTGVTVRPKLYIACGISGQIQHTAGMEESSMVIAINNDPLAPINKLADYVITGEVMEIIPKLIKYYKKNSK